MKQKPNWMDVVTVLLLSVSAVLAAYLWRRL